MKLNARGFTLIELLVVIAIIAILAVAGFAAFRGFAKSANDGRRKADINAIAKAYEGTFTSGYNRALVDADFGSGSVPVDPSKGEYFNVRGVDGSGFKVCAALEANPNQMCNTSAANCYCVTSSLKAFSNVASANLSGSAGSIGLGYGSSGSAPACDPNGTLSSGLVGWWRFDESSGSTASDSSGNGNNATWNTPSAWTTGKFGNSAQFASGTPNLSIPSNSNLQASGDFTWVGWFNHNALPSENALRQGMIRKLEGSWSVNAGYNLEAIEGNVYRLTVGNGTSGLSITTTMPGKLMWNFVAFWYNSSTNNINIKVNNNSTVTSPFTGVPVVGTNPVYFGLNSSGGTYMNGLMDDIRLYDRVLSTEELSALYNSGNGCVP